MTETSDDESEYAKLLADILPKVVETPAEHERVMNVIHKLIAKASLRTVAETKVLRVLAVLVSNYEAKLNLFPANETELSSMTAHQLLKATVKMWIGGIIFLCFMLLIQMFFEIKVDTGSYLLGFGWAAMWFISDTAPVTELRRKAVKELFPDN